MLQKGEPLTATLPLDTLTIFTGEVFMFRKLLRPYPITAISTFVLPVLIHQSTPPWPGNLIASVTFIVLAVAALALERQGKAD
ncbi:hypothetical protein MED193_17129 [Roseobacter sp. MED193]|nr:hypothetical protein MED193_17129 [Roseobacter sp. MED193]